jgi:hypothetical protein
MALWGNTDSANSKPHLPVERQVRAVATLVTANATTAGNTIVFTTAPSVGLVGSYVYTDRSSDANAAISRFFDTSLVDQNDAAYFKANNTVVSVDAANNLVRLANNVVATLAIGKTVYFANAIVQNTGSAEANTYHQDTILVTPTRLANNTVAIGNLNTGWVNVRKKINNDSTVRYIHETLVCLSDPVASNTNSGNTSFGQMYTGV